MKTEQDVNHGNQRHEKIEIFEKIDVDDCAQPGYSQQKPTNQIN